MAGRLGRAMWLGAARIGVAVAVLGTGAVVRASVAGGPSGGDADEAGAPTTSVAAITPAPVPVDSTAPDADPMPVTDAAPDAGAPTTVLVAAPIPPSQTPTLGTAAPTHVRSVDAVWLEGNETELHLQASGTDPCTAEVKVEENAAVIYVYVYEHAATQPSCTAADAGRLVAKLDQPLAGRAVVDAVSGEEFVVGLGGPAPLG